jgi:EAL domain-containing protein (putative c-di-GMP-specific phosphodiesterase class I)
LGISPVVNGQGDAGHDFVTWPRRNPAIVAFARESGAYIIAEGIENRAMLDTIQFDEDGLRKFWVKAVQGFLFGKPRQSVEDYLRESKQDRHAA